MIEIPAAISQQEISLESLLAMEAGWEVDGIKLPPMTAGHLMLLDIVEYIEREQVTSLYGVREAVAVFRYGKGAVQPIFRAVSMEGDKQWQEMAEKQFCVTEKNYEAVDEQVLAQVEYAMAGFEMLPDNNDGSQSGKRYDAEWLSSIMGAVSSSCPAMTRDGILWEMPLVLVGHLVAATARANGEKTSRPIDYETAFKELQNWQTNGQN